VGPGGEEGRHRKRVPGAGGGAVPAGRGRGNGEGTQARRSPETTPRQPRIGEPERTTRQESAERRPLLRAGAGRRETSPAGTEAERESRVAHRRRLLALPFRDFTSRDVEEARALVQELGARLPGRLARRERRTRAGRLDFRGT